MDSTDAELIPRGADEALWAATPPGTRIRWLRGLQYQLPMTPRQYEALARLPYWQLYGPENGAPAEWFNEQGYLLPKYRPGGPRFAEFLARRREFRGRRLLYHLVRERRHLLRERHKTLLAVAAVAGYVAALFAGLRLARIWFDDGPHIVPGCLLGLLLYAGGWLVVTYARERLEEGLVDRSWARRRR